MSAPAADKPAEQKETKQIPPEDVEKAKASGKVHGDPIVEF